VLEATDKELAKGKAGVTAGASARFQDFHVYASNAAAEGFGR
jgi:hypothetical protein